jgi:uncharacterized protein YecE (DUF72 family)
MTIFIGTSGWHYGHWRGPFYPDDLTPEQMLRFYSTQFEAVEVNSSFYRLPQRATLLVWKEATPDCFVFAFKASRYLTHMKKLTDAGDALAAMLERARVLGPKLGPVLFQLPPRWRVDVDRLRQFLAILPRDIRAAFEFRDPSWFSDAVYESLRESAAGFCIYDLGGTTSRQIVTSDLAYVRLHGPGGPYQGLYDTGTLSNWADSISAWNAEGRDVYCFFDNDEHGYATRNARELRALLSLPSPA